MKATTTIGVFTSVGYQRCRCHPWSSRMYLLYSGSGSILYGLKQAGGQKLRASRTTVTPRLGINFAETFSFYYNRINILLYLYSSKALNPLERSDAMCESSMLWCPAGSNSTLRRGCSVAGFCHWWEHIVHDNWKARRALKYRQMAGINEELWAVNVPVGSTGVYFPTNSQPTTYRIARFMASIRCSPAMLAGWWKAKQAL